MKRRTFLGLLSAFVFVPRGTIPKVAEEALPPIDIPALGELSPSLLSYVTRRSYLSSAYTQVWNTSPILCSMLGDAEEAPFAKVEYVKVEPYFDPYAPLDSIYTEDKPCQS
jgi:hypothetical protein